MPATCPFLLHPFSLLLLLGPHLFVGSFSLGSPSSASPTGRSSLATAGPRGVASIQGGSTFLAASSLLPREKGSPQPSAASVSVWDPATERDSSSDSPAIMTRQKDAESPNTKAKISSSYIHSLDPVSTSGSDKIRTLWTNLTSASASVTGSATSYTKIIRSVNVVQHLSQMIQTKRASASPNMVGIAESESVTLRKYFPKTPNSSFLEKKHSDTDQLVSSTERRISNSDMENMTILSISNRGEEKILRTLRGSSSSQSPRSVSTISNLEMSSNGEKILRTLRGSRSSQDPRSVSTISNLEMSSNGEKILRTLRGSSSSQSPRSVSSVSSLEMSSNGEEKLRTRRGSRSSQDPRSVSTISSLEMSSNGEKILRTLRGSRSSQDPRSVSTISNLEMSSNGEKILRTLRGSSSSQSPRSVSSVSSLEMSSNGEEKLRTRRGSRSSQDPRSVSTISSLEMSSNGEKILRTLRGSSSSQSPRSVSSVSSLEMSSNGEEKLRTRRDSSSSQDPRSVSTISSLEMSSNGEEKLRTRRGSSSSQDPRSVSTISNLEMSSNGEEKLRTLRGSSSSQSPRSVSSVSSLEMSSNGEEKLRTRRDSSSSQDPRSVSTISSLEMSSNGEEKLRTLRGSRSSQDPRSVSTISNLEMSSNGEEKLRTRRGSSSSQDPRSVSTISSLEMSSNGEEKLRTLRDSSSSQDPHSALGVSKMSSNGEKILRTLRGSSSSQSPRSVSSVSSLEMSSNGEEKLRTLRGSRSSQDPRSVSTISNLEMSSNGEEKLRTRRGSSSSQDPRSVSTISSLEMSSNREEKLRTRRGSSSSQDPRSVSTISNLEMSSNGEEKLQTRRGSSSSQDPRSVSTISNLEMSSNGEEKLQTLRDSSSSQDPHSVSTISSLEMSSNGEEKLRTLRGSRSSQDPRSVSTVSILEIPSNREEKLRTLRDSSSSQDPHSALGVSKMSSNGEKILRTLGGSSSSQSPRSVSSVSSLEMSSSSGLRGSSYVVVPADSRQMDLSALDTDKSEATDTHSQSPSATTAVEGRDWKDSRSNRERKMSSSYMDSVSVRDEEKSQNVTQTFITANTFSSSKLSVRPEQTGEMRLSGTDFVFTEEAFILSQATTEQNGQQQSSSETESIASNFYTQSRSDRSGERMLQTLRHTSSSHHPQSISTATHSEIPRSSGLTDSSYVLTPVQTRQRDLSPGFTHFMETASTHPWDSSQTTAAEDSSRLRSSLIKEKIFSSQTAGVSVSSLSKRGEESTLRTVRDVSSSESDTQTSTVANTTISSSSDFVHSFHMKSPGQTDQDLSPGDTDFTEGMLILSQAPSETTVEEENGQSHSSSSTGPILSTYHLNSSSISYLSDLDGERTVRTLRDVSSAHNVTQGSIAWHNKTSSSSGLTDSSYLLTPIETDLTPQMTDFTEGTSTHLQASSEKTESSDQSSSISNTETRISHSEQDSASISSLLDRDDETTLQTLREVKDVHNVTQISITVNANITSSFNIADASSYTMTPKHTRQMNSSSGDHDFTEEALTHSEVPSETTDTRSRHHALSNFNIEKRATQTEGMFSTTVVKDETFASLTNQSRSTDATELSSFDLKNTGSSVIIQTSSATLQSRKENSPSTGMDFTETLEQSLLTTSSKASGYSSSTKDFSSSANHFQKIKGSDVGRRFSIASTDSVYLSTTFVHGAERTLRSLPDISTSNDAEDNNTYNSQTSKSSGGSLTLTSVTETEKHNISLSEGQSTGPFTEYSLEYSSVVPTSLSPNDSSTNGSNHNSTSGPRVLQSYTASIDSSAPFSEGEEQTTQPTINTTVTEETESISLSIENFDSSRSKPSSSKTYSRMTDLAVKVLDISPSSTEAFQILSSSTYSSFKSELSDTGTDYQPMSSTDFGKQTSVSHTDSTYTLTTSARGGERTLLSLPNNSTPPDSSGSSTYSAEISNPSKSFSSEMDFSENSTEPLAVHSLKTSEYSSTVSEPHTTQFYSESESASTGSLSFSSSSTILSEQDSLPPAQPSTLFSSAKSSVPSSSSAFLLPLSSSPPTSLMTFSPMLSSTEPPTLPFFPSLLPSLSSTPSLLQPSGSLETSVSMAEPEGTTGAELHMTGSSHGEYNRQTTGYPLENSTILMATGTFPLNEISKQPANHSSSGTTSQEETKGQTLTLPGISTENVPIMTTSPPYLQEMTTVSEAAKATVATLLHTNPQKDTFHSSTVTVGEKITKITHTPGRLPTSASTMNYLFTTKVQLPSPTKISYSTGIPTKMMEKSSTTTVKTTVPRIVITSSPYTLTSHKTFQSFPASLVPPRPTTTVGPGSPKISPTPYGKDVDGCLSNPCPTLATCTNIQGSFQCICSLGYQMGKGKCNLVRTFVGQFPLTGGTYSELHQIEGVIINLLNESLSTLPGYYTSTVKALRQEGTVQISILSTFSMASNVTFSEVISTVQSHIRACKTPTQSCQFFSNLTQLYRVGGLCKHKDPECDKGTSVCVDLDGIAVCQCKPGYFKYNKLDHSCRACEDGYKLENDTCVSCPFGLGGFNCRNPYQLIAIVIAAAGGGLLLIMGIALIVTCCQKNKNDISKLIFKSGDFQMSPYAEYPKNPRVQDWSRETIEMQENGSTKNLLQMTDVYYMPTNLRNPELERNGVYPPYTGLPGSRHSCIYPGQYNPSFICDDSRRRDYF
ncbi:protein HEG homolog 1 [Candoia aspera]|uniref:protein HEG homolog 1 n=1 Tax=Candoia aspera TaxID=51853 RepID=UPI002FD7C13B